MDAPNSFPRLRQTVIDTSEPRRLAEFYRALLGLEYRRGDEPAEGEPAPDWLVLHGDGGSTRLAFQYVADLPRPVWPDGHPPQMMHLDTTVSDRAELERQRHRAESLGASLLLDRTNDPDEALYVFADPSGHPFCIFVSNVPDRG